jgi:hypothetical protein
MAVMIPLLKSLFLGVCGVVLPTAENFNTLMLWVRGFGDCVCFYVFSGNGVLLVFAH